MPFLQTATSDVPFEDFLAYCKEIGCRVEDNEIIFDTDEQMADIKTWLTKHDFTGETT
jgi:hypothetical protein